MSQSKPIRKQNKISRETELKKKEPVSWLHISKVWLSLPSLSTAEPEQFDRLGIASPPAAQFCKHINRVTWILGFSMVTALVLIGQGAWDWQAPIAVGGVFASNAYNRKKFGLGGEKEAFATALLLIVAGIVGAFHGLVSGTTLAIAILSLHLLWHLVILRFFRW